ncbi:MAG: hypothetical protein AABX03_04495 [Nanoarchaeota archaeon]
MEKDYSGIGEPILRKRNDISRRRFLDNLINYSTATGLIFGGPAFVATAKMIGDANEDLCNSREEYHNLSELLGNVEYNNAQRRMQEIEDQKKQRKIELDAQREKEALDKLMESELYAPGSFSFAEESSRLTLAKTIFCEAEAEFKHPNFMKLVGISVLRRSYLTKWDVKKVVSYTHKNKETGIESYAYSFMRPKDKQNPQFKNPLLGVEDDSKIFDSWAKAYGVAKSLLPLKHEELDPLVTHFYTNWVPKPAWAQKRIPVVEISHKGHVTSFYDIPKDIEYMARFG